MLKSIDPLLNADILYVLAAMGHGDEIAIVDANFPAAATALRTAHGRLLRLDGVDVARACRAVLSLLPLDSFVPHPAAVMQVVGDPAAVPEAVAAIQAEIDHAAGRHWPVESLERFAFYARAEKAFAVLATGETRLYGNVIIKKGVIPGA